MNNPVFLISRISTFSKLLRPDIPDHSFQSEKVIADKELFFLPVLEKYSIITS